MITNPENLPKDRLKAELKKKGISFNTNENKKYYVDLYRKKILNPELARSEFSDDDVSRSPVLKKSSPKKSRKSGKGGSHVSLVQSLSDDELLDELVDLGEDPGPINASTRMVYERKLVKLLEEEESTRKRPAPSYAGEPDDIKEPDEVNNSFIGEWSDDGHSEEEEEEEERKGRYNLRRRDTPSQESLMEKKQTPSRAPVQSPPLRPQPSLKYPRRSSPRRGDRGSSPESCKTLWSFFLLLITFAAVFLLYEHFTVPDGTSSLLTQGYDSFLGFVMAPLMEKQEEVQTPPSVRSDEPPLEDPSTPPPSGKPKTPPTDTPKDPPPSGKPKDTPPSGKPKDTPPSGKPKDTPPSGKPKAPPTDKPKDPPPTDDHPPTEAPSANKPEAPSADKPEAPSADKPEAPSTDKPEATSADKPEAPSANKPSADKPKNPPPTDNRQDNEPAAKPSTGGPGKKP